jgi:hypothetical protein
MERIMSFEITDRDHNRLYFRGNEIFLQLAIGGKTRRLGEVAGGTFYTLRSTSKHEMRRDEEFGFNYNLIKFGLFKNIVVRSDDGREFQTTRRWVLRYGKPMRPGGTRFELQLFLPLSEFKGFTEPPEEPLLVHEIEPTLFDCEEVR